MTFLKKLLSEKKGQDLAEYGIALAVIGAGILDAPVGVDQQIGWRLPMQEGHGQSF